ncbi:hypothetical protein GW17_00055900 [Ensete ventricosum]|nr:hypothetical protein GW17_00055900 [Ensete ventricosum]
MRVDFPRWEEGDLIGWISCTKCCFRFHRTTDASMVEIAAVHLEGDAIQWFDWFKRTHGEDEDNEPHEESLKPEEEVTKEEPQSVEFTVQALADYSNL